MRSLIVLLLLLAADAQAATAVSFCELAADPAKYDRRQIELTGFVSHGFEDFTLFDPTCTSENVRVWVEYGGTHASRTTYCCGTNADATRPRPLVVDGVPTTLVRSAKLKEFDRLALREPDSIVHATMRGRFFAGEKTSFPGGTFWVGYGHMGLYSLFVIEEIVQVDAPRDGLDPRGAPDQAEADCARSLGGVTHARAIEQQKEAEAGTRAWAFDDSLRVATEHLQRVSTAAANVQLTVVGKSTGRVVYGGAGADGNGYWVVVSRPYWLSFSAANAKRVAWVAIGAEETGCEEQQ
ncbi:MAG TPA: hypothetical protein VHW00_17040 [Thermoanaerobaculia bacterium]|nr:hypothetical protein [Thermoanaerobaculia bacterium]